MSLDELHETRNERFRGLYKDTLEHFIDSPHIVIGCGSIGGYIIRSLGQIGIKHIELWDPDKVEQVNIGPQGFYPSEVESRKVDVQETEFNLLTENIPNVVTRARFAKFTNQAKSPEKAYWWLCVDSLDAREKIYSSALGFDPYRIIDMRMGGLMYEIFCNINFNKYWINRYLDTIRYARENPVEENCTTRSTPHAAMIAASIGINAGLTKCPPFSITGDLLSYRQETEWQEKVRESESLYMAKYLWAKLGDIPVNNDGELLEPFMNFEAGTDREDIWHWFEEEFGISVHDDLMFPTKLKGQNT